MKPERNYLQLKEEENTLGKNWNKINNLPDKEFKNSVIKMLTELGKKNLSNHWTL